MSLRGTLDAGEGSDVEQGSVCGAQRSGLRHHLAGDVGDGGFYGLNLLAIKRVIVELDAQCGAVAVVGNDGGQIAREVLLTFNPRDGIRQSLWLSIVAAVGMAVFGLSREMYFTAIFFAYLAYSSYIMLEAYRGQDRW